ncbi:uncharacterized protein LOC123818636 [Phyllostomus hastatus]|uniref:uncharacterized protein LOC123818636 n=1 Tax=Phyllostomus hastatus TaxID=9423 RepID=UPI001E68299F|nr:uncharacterized protein LOC123818636 [Phyllostomus hastatus]
MCFFLDFLATTVCSLAWCELLKCKHCVSFLVRPAAPVPRQRIAGAQTSHKKRPMGTELAGSRTRSFRFLSSGTSTITQVRGLPRRQARGGSGTQAVRTQDDKGSTAPGAAVLATLSQLPGHRGRGEHRASRAATRAAWDPRAGPHPAGTRLIASFVADSVLMEPVSWTWDPGAADLPLPNIGPLPGLCGALFPVCTRLRASSAYCSEGEGEVRGGL